MNTQTKLAEIRETLYIELIAEFGEIPEAVDHNGFELRLEDRRDRYEAMSAAAAGRSDAAYEASRAATQGIVPGQPILIGHHSEGKHRRAIGKADAAMRRNIDEQKKSEYYADRAESVGSGGIDSTDPDAIRKLLLKLLDLQISQEKMKAANAIIRSKAKKYSSQESKILALIDLGFSDGEATQLLLPDDYQGLGFPGYRMSNNNANMKRIKARLKSLASLAKIEDKTHVFFDGWLTVEINREEGRVLLSNPSKPSEAVRTVYKQNGYSWSPRRDAWSRKLTAAAVNSVASVRRSLATLAEDNFN